MFYWFESTTHLRESGWIIEFHIYFARVDATLSGTYLKFHESAGLSIEQLNGTILAGILISCFITRNQAKTRKEEDVFM